MLIGIAGRPAPRLILKEHVEAMKRKSDRPNGADSQLVPSLLTLLRKQVVIASLLSPERR